MQWTPGCCRLMRWDALRWGLLCASLLACEEPAASEDSEDAAVASPVVDAQPELPDGEGVECQPGQTRPCPDGCPNSVQVCLDGRLGPCVAPAELCDGVDQDCDGVVDEEACDPPCQPMPEVCDGLDQDCDGLVDEPPILPAASVLPLPVGARNLHALVWLGEILAVVAGGYPNWLVQVSIQGPTVWQVSRFGTFPVELAAAAIRRGVVLVWPERAGPMHMGLLGEDGVFIRVISPLEVGLGATEVQVVSAGERAALAWTEPGEAGPRIYTALVDPITGTVAHGPYDLGPGKRPRLVTNGEDGFGLLFESPEGGVLAMVRLSLLAEPAFAPVRVAAGVFDAALNGDYYIEELPVVYTQGDAIHLQRFTRLGVPVGTAIELAHGPNPGGLHLLRVDTSYALFYTLGEGRLYAQPIARGGQPLADAQLIAEGVAALHATTAGLEYALAWWQGDGVALQSGPLLCPVALPP